MRGSGACWITGGASLETPCLLASGRKILSYGGLWEQCRYVEATLASAAGDHNTIWDAPHMFTIARILAGQLQEDESRKSRAMSRTA